MLEGAAMKKGWFVIDGVQQGDRTIEQQAKGLEAAADRFVGKAVLDLGCAEGLLGRHCVDAYGAAIVDGVTCIQYEIDEAERQCAGKPQHFFLGDLRTKAGTDYLDSVLLPCYDVVLLLSILHKVRDPMRLLEWAVRFATETIIIRLPEPIIDMERCRPGVHPVHPWMLERFGLIAEPETCVEPVSGKPEWMGIYAAR